MKALKNILTEGILADVDTVINQTDQLFADAEREFAALKNHFLNVKNYDNWKSRTGYHRYTAEFPIPAIVKLLNVNDGINILEITFIKTQSTGPGRTVTYWATKMLVYEKYNDVCNDQYLRYKKRVVRNDHSFRLGFFGNHPRSPRVKNPNKSCVSSRIISVTNSFVSVFSLPTNAE